MLWSTESKAFLKLIKIAPITLPLSRDSLHISVRYNNNYYNYTLSDLGDLSNLIGSLYYLGLLIYTKTVDSVFCAL